MFLSVLQVNMADETPPKITTFAPGTFAKPGSSTGAPRNRPSLTVTIDAEVLDKIEERERATGDTKSRTVEQLLRIGLGMSRVLVVEGHPIGELPHDPA